MIRITFIYVYFRLKQRGQVADMNTIIDAVHQDWSSLVSSKTRMSLFSFFYLFTKMNFNITKFVK